MIYTITLNPALDKTLIIENFSINKLNRVMSLRKDAGGKGINVSKMLNKFEEETCAMGFLGHDSGKFIQKFLTDEGIETDFVINNDIETRTNIKIVDTLSSTYTDINEPGGKILYEDIIKLESFFMISYILI